ncbi:hypothetical protein CMO90_01995 [Candidatus Woesearchaeota archaeon]|jgi:hypothetical protein|nr:hypothetical protein [Candidatus Woesearchaeota archaeon]|tara:strand:- start:5701 stop:6084 length:384 start_codon:yes stop_codon:yes gene_type:complete
MLSKQFLKKNSINFSKYTFIGLIVSLLNIFFVWLLIDILKIETLMATSLVVMSVFFLKFYLYILIKLIKKQFFKYVAIQIISALLNIVLTWFLIDILLIRTVIAVILVVGSLFLARFSLFKVTRLII